MASLDQQIPTHRRKPLRLASFVVVLWYGLIVSSGFDLSSAAPGFEAFDVRWKGYSIADIEASSTLLNREQLGFYQRFRHLDFGFPLFYGPVLAIWFHRWFGGLSNPLGRKLWLLPLCVALCDFIENILLTLFISNDQLRVDAMVLASSILTQLKLSGLVLLILGGVFAVFLNAQSARDQ